jgi:hypothetical protein
MNVGPAATTVTCSFGPDADTGPVSYGLTNVTLQPNEALTDIQQGKIAENYVGSATCTASEASAQIVAVVKELGSIPNTDTLMIYEGVSTGSEEGDMTSVFVPGVHR